MIYYAIDKKILGNVINDISQIVVLVHTAIPTCNNQHGLPTPSVSSILVLLSSAYATGLIAEV